jgi:hypothetical protein
VPHWHGSNLLPIPHDSIASCEEAVGQAGRNCADLPQKSLLVPDIPAGNEFSIGDLDYHQSAYLDPSPGGRNADTVAIVRAFQHYADHDPVAFRDGVFDSYVKIGKRGPEITGKGLELRWAVDHSVAFTQAKYRGAGSKQLVYRVFPALVPDFLKPPMNNCFVFCAHWLLRFGEKTLTQVQGPQIQFALDGPGMAS